MFCVSKCTGYEDLFPEFNHSRSSTKASRDADLNHLSAFDF